MPGQVLVAYDDSPEASAALEFALEEFTDAAFTLLAVIDPADTGSRRRLAIPPFGDEWLERAREDADAVLADAEDRVTDAGRPAETVVEIGRPAKTIVAYAAEHDVDHVVMGSHGRTGVTRILLGSVAETVIRRSPVPVTVTRDADSDLEPDPESEMTQGSA